MDRHALHLVRWVYALVLGEVPEAAVVLQHRRLSFSGVPDDAGRATTPSGELEGRHILVGQTSVPPGAIPIDVHVEIVVLFDFQ